MSHTPEPWPPLTPEEIILFGDEGVISPKDFEHARQCVNGCAGFNPAAFRECVEALKEIATMTTKPNKREWAFLQVGAIACVKQALAHAEAQP